MGQALPFGQGVDHLAVGAHIGDVKGQDAPRRSGHRSGRCGRPRTGVRPGAVQAHTKAVKRNSWWDRSMARWSSLLLRASGRRDGGFTHSRNASFLWIVIQRNSPAARRHVGLRQRRQISSGSRRPAAGPPAPGTRPEEGRPDRGGSAQMVRCPRPAHGKARIKAGSSNLWAAGWRHTAAWWCPWRHSRRRGRPAAPRSRPAPGPGDAQRGSAA